MLANGMRIFGAIVFFITAARFIGVGFDWLTDFSPPWWVNAPVFAAAGFWMLDRIGEKP